MNKSREKTLYVVVRANSTSGKFVVCKDGYIKEEFYADSIFASAKWHEVENHCQCGDLAITAGHFTNKREAEREAKRINREERND